jgi:hypothetical protein
MATLSDKYIAGFVDADGCINVDCRPSRPLSIALSFSQIAGQDVVLHEIQRALGGDILDHPVNGVMYKKHQLYGRKAVMVLHRIKKYLVVKRHYANVCLDVLGRRDITRQWLKEQRRIKSLPLPNFPTRKWLAGYFDGDGCLSVQRIRPNGSACIVAHIACSQFDTEGIEIIHKNFGGNIGNMRGGSCRQWTLYLQPSKAKKFLGYFTKDLLIKREQSEYILSCAEIGHYHNGGEIKSALKQLKSHEHRLNGMGVQSIST